MADEIAVLGVAVDSTAAVSASKDIDALAAAGDRAAASAKKLGTSWESITFSPQRMYAANVALNKFRRESAQTAAEIPAVDGAWKKNLFSSGKLMKANAALREFRQSVAEASRASTQSVGPAKILAESHHQVAKAAAGYTKSAKEMAFATRNLPAQFTDIAVSLQAGQNPLTVLLQQGGQLKDMFGGIGPAARALGGYIKGLVNPYTVAASAVALLTIAWVKGDAEARKFHATLEMQGNTLGVTTDGLVQASEEMTRFGQSQGAAAAALNATAASGKIFGSSIQTVAQAALNMERETGQAIEKTVEQFSSLSGAPVDAAIKLDEQYKFLTVSVYEQIRALEDQGDKMGAAQVAMDSLADTMNERTADIEGNLGTLEKMWRLVANSAKWAWDQMLNIGRESSVSDKIVELNDKIREINNPSNFASFSQLGGKGSDARKAYVKNLQDQIRDLQVVYRKEQEKAALAQTQEQGRIAAISLAEEARRGKSNAEKRVAEKARIEADVTRAISGIVAKSEAERVAAETTIRKNGAAAIAAMEKRLADPKEKKTPKSQEAKDAERLLRERARDYENLDRALDQHQETLNAAGEAQDKLSAFERFAIKTLSDLDNGHTALDLSQRQEIKTRIESLRVIDRQNQERLRENKIMENTADLVRSIAQDEAAQNRSLSQEKLGVGRGQNEAALAAALEEIRYRALLKREELEKRARETHSVGTQSYLDDLAKINAYENRMAAAEVQRLEDRKAAMADWRNGARSAMEDIAWTVGDVAGRTRDGFMSAFASMNSALDNFAKTGKMKIRDFATTVIAELLRIALTIALSKILTSMFGATAASGAGSAGETQAFNNWFQANNAKGNVFQGGNQLKTFALGGVNGIIRTSPTLFPFAGGTGLMSEHEPEAIVPLGRGPDGKLGIRSTGGGGSMTNVGVTVNISQDGKSNSSVDVDGENSRDGRRLGLLLDKKIREVIADERRQGGTLWAMQNGR